MSFEGKTFIILGATGDIGKETCRLLKERDVDVVGFGRDQEKLDALKGDLGIEVQQLDLLDFDALMDAVKGVADGKELGGIANLVGSLYLKPAHLTSQDDFNEVVQTNLGSAFNAVRAGAKAMMRTGGSIVLVSSVAGRFGLMNHEAIAAAKGGISGLVMAAAASYAPRGIRVNCVAPGLIETQMTERLTGNEKAREASVAMHPVGRIGEPGDIARAVVFLLDPANSFITGQEFGVDGGMSRVRPK